MANLPMDLLNDLFLRLPASTLVRCRILSKPCISLIDSPDFVASHLKRTLETEDHLMILMRAPEGVLRTVYLDAPDKVTDLEHPLLQTEGFTEVFGSCNGLVGLANSLMDMALFNPSTRKIHRLPVQRFELIDLPPGCSVTRECVLYGVGYDSVSQDYKVLRMVQSKGSVFGNGVVSYGHKVFSLKRNSWRGFSMDDETHCYDRVSSRHRNGVLASNFLHWVLPPVQGVVASNTIVRFDLDAEEFGILGLPQDLDSEGKMDIGVLDGCLCLMGYIPGFTHVDVWIMKEYNVEGDWTKVFRVTKPDSVESLEFVRPLVYSKDRSKVLLEMNVGKLVWFDLVSQSFETFGIKGCDGLCSAEIVVSSLVLGCNKDPRRARGNQMMEKRNKRGDGFLSKGFKLKL